MPATPPHRPAKLLLALASALLAGGVALAVLEPGSLGDDDVESEGAQEATTTTEQDATTTTPDEPDDVTSTTRRAGGQSAGSSTTTTTEAPATTTTAPGSSATTTPASTTSVPGSGLGSAGVSRADDATAATGIESMLGPSLALAGIGLALRRTTRRSRS